MTIYIAGPMRGYPNNNFEAFDKAKAKLESFDCSDCGCIKPYILTPADSARLHPDATEKEWIERDIKMVLQSDAIFMLRGWELSKGARAEHALAVWAGKEIHYQSLEDIEELNIASNF